METIKVNMSPNPLDVQTIHASQNDGEARQWEFELHNNGELIDTSDVKEQLVFKAYKGGTEQLLPENGSVPTTSPIIADIKYPHGEMTDQEFLYRQSPTEEDGNAKITDIKGNTLVWNQLVQNGNFASTDSWVSRGTGTSFTVSNNVATIKAGAQWGGINQNLISPVDQSHKFLVIADIKGTTDSYISIGGMNTYVTQNNVWQRLYIELPSTISRWLSLTIGDRRSSGWTEFNVKNAMLIDLTMMFGSGNEPTFEEFTSLFPLPFYDFNQGSLLSFNGNGIKTVGKNLLGEMHQGLLNVSDGYSIQSNPYWLYSDFYPCKNAEYITFSANIINRGVIYKYDANRNFIGISQVMLNYKYITTPNTENICWIRVGFNINGASQQVTPQDIGTYEMQLELNSLTPYEPYTSSTLSLPISTYFPTGMKSAGSVYDELTPTKAITRIGAVDLGSLNWTYQSSSENMYADNVVSNRKNNLGFNAICSKYQQVNEDTISGVSSLVQDKSFAFQYSFNGRIIVRDTSYTDATVFKQAMADQNVKLYYELATPTETSFTTASLVTGNAEIPLSNEDGTLIGKCTEQLSENPGFIDAKIKLSDSDGTCYSNKLQLHVERSPQ